MNRYETILTQIVAAAIASGRWDVSHVVQSATIRDAAASLETHFQNMDALRLRQQSDDLPAFLKKQAE